MKKRISLFLALVMVIQLVGTTSIKVDATTVHKISTVKQFTGISKYSGGSFKLTKDIRLTSKKQYLILNKNKTYTLDLNGHKIVEDYYTSEKIRDDIPIQLKKGTLKIKNTSKTMGGIYGTEGATIFATGGKLYTYNNVYVSNNHVSPTAGGTGIVISGTAKYYAKGGVVLGTCNGVMVAEQGELYTYGAGEKIYPEFAGRYMNGLYIVSRTAKAVLKGGSFYTFTSSLSGFTPIMDAGLILKEEAGYAFVNANGQHADIITEIYYRYVEGVYDSVNGCKWIGIVKR